MRVLVTGAFGFIGTAVTERLALAGHEVVALTHRAPDAPVPASPVSQIIHADVHDVDGVRRAVRGVDAVCHLAALARVRESFARPDEYWQVNAVGTENLVRALAAEAATGGRPARFVHASTHAVYGVPPRGPISEDAPLSPSSPYGRSKVAAEESVATSVSDTHTLGAVCLRTFNVAGAAGGRTDMDQTRIIPQALAVAAGRVPALEVNGDGGAVRDFVHVADVASAYLLALAGCQPGTCAVYNVGATAASVLDVVTVAEQITGRSIPVRHNSPVPEPRALIADTTTIRHDLSWAPRHSSLDQIIGEAWEIFRLP